jgi:plastocyanin
MKIAVIGALVGASALIAAAAYGETVVNQKDKQFSQEVLTIKSGQKVHFVNDDNVTHNLMIKDPSGAGRPGIVQKPGEQSDVEFSGAGEHEVRCLIHPKMKLRITVD